MSAGSFRRPFQAPMVAITVKLPPDLVRWLDEQARARKVTRTKLIHDHLRAQQRVQEQLAESFTLGEADGEGTGKQILHAALARHTEAVARSIDRLTAVMGEQRGAVLITPYMVEGLAAGLLGAAGYKEWKGKVQSKMPQEQKP